MFWQKKWSERQKGSVCVNPAHRAPARFPTKMTADIEPATWVRRPGNARDGAVWAWTAGRLL
tara:strand:- start:15960 stop:16145 length:186 start_codon:yes stop_codon:yes gene_type:complete